MNKDEVISQLKKIIEDQMEITILNPDEPLDIDSFTMTLIITFTNEKIGVQLDMESLDLDDFKSLTSLAELITSQPKL